MWTVSEIAVTKPLKLRGSHKDVGIVCYVLGTHPVVIPERLYLPHIYSDIYGSNADSAAWMVKTV